MLSLLLLLLFSIHLEVKDSAIGPKRISFDITGGTLIVELWKTPYYPYLFLVSGNGKKITGFSLSIKKSATEDHFAWVFFFFFVVRTGTCKPIVQSFFTLHTFFSFSFLILLWADIAVKVKEIILLKGDSFT